MLLSDLIAQFHDDGVAMEAVVAMEDLALLARLQDRAQALGLSPGEFVGRAVATFSTAASEADWTGLLGILAEANDPGQACLRRMIEYALRSD